MSLALAPIDVIPHIQYEEEWYRVQEEAGYVTLALVLKGNTSVPVTVTVRTLDLLDSSVGATPTGELLELFRFGMLEGLPNIVQSWLHRVAY